MEVTLDVQVVLGISLVLFGVGVYLISVVKNDDSSSFAMHLVMAMIYGGGSVSLISGMYWAFNW